MSTIVWVQVYSLASAVTSNIFTTPIKKKHTAQRYKLEKKNYDVEKTKLDVLQDQYKV